MANEFIARKGLIVLANGATVTGSLQTQGNINASGYSVSASRYTGSFYGDGSNLTGITATGLDIDLFGADLTGITVAGTDKMIISDAGTEGRINVSQLSTPLAGTGLEANAGTIRIAAAAAGDGLTGGAGSALAVGAGNGITVSADDISVNTGSAHFISGARATISVSDTAGSNGVNLEYVAGNITATLVNDTVTVTAGNGLTNGGSVTLGGSTTLDVGAGDGISVTTDAVSLNTGSTHFTSGVTKALPTGTISSSAQFTSITAPFTGSFSGSFVGDGSGLSGIASTLSFSGSTSGNDTLNLKTETLIFSGSNGITATVTDNTVTFAAPEGTVTSSAQINYTGLQNIPVGIVSSSAQVTTLLPPGSVSSSGQVDHNATANYVPNEHINHSNVSITAGSGLSGGGDITTSRTLSLDTSSAHFTGGVKSKLNVDGVISSSAQVDVRLTTGIETIATTGSNTFTGVQTISNTTNSTNYTDGALIVQGGVGIAKDVNISGSLNIQGVLTVATMSTQYVTSSQYNIGVSRIIVNDDDLVRFAGISVVDSGSTYGTGSLLWDSLNNHWIYQADDQAYNSAILIAGPKNTGALGDEVGLISGRIPVATGTDHIDTNAASSSIYIDFTTKKTFIESGLYVTGSVSASLGFTGSFYGDGSGLSGIASNLAEITANGADTTELVFLNGGAIINGVLYTSGSNLDVDTGTEVITTIPSASYDAAYFDYVVKKSTNYRAGTVMAVWDQIGNVEFTDTSTNDIGNTSEVIMSVDTLGADIRLKSTVSTNDWIVKTSVRAL